LLPELPRRQLRQGASQHFYPPPPRCSEIVDDWPDKSTLRWTMVAVMIGAFLGLILRRRDLDAIGRDIEKVGADLGQIIGNRWRDSDARDKAMLDYTNSLRRLTWVMALMTVISTAFVIYSAVH
jgi:hypothetical protein